MNNRQIGQFKIDHESIQQDPDRVAAIFSIIDCVPVRCVWLFAESAISYTAIAETFDVVPEGSQIPEYDLIVTLNEFGSIESVNAKRIK